MTKKQDVKQTKKVQPAKDVKKSSFCGWFFWIFLLTTLASAFYIARLDIIRLNFENPLDCGYIEYPKYI